MKKIYAKLAIIALQLLMTLSVVAVSTYAWLVISSAPAVEGIQIAIGGGNTILLAPDVSYKTEDGRVFHYPGQFQDTLTFNQHETYNYLKDIGALTPVSTADGINWFLPTYYDVTDQAVKDGEAAAGSLKPFQEFRQDTLLEYANLTPDQTEQIEKGHYVYLDFWACSPGQEYTLRVSTGNEDSGSCAVSLMEAGKENGACTLVDGENDVTSSVRVGFLANPDEILDETMLYYRGSPTYADQYKKLRGVYTEKDSGYQVYALHPRFYIYEPNGDSHAADHPLAEDGTYVLTEPVGLVNGFVQPVNISDRLSVQKRSFWQMAENGAGTQIEQLFQAALLIPGFQDGLEAEELTDKFYDTYLGGQFAPYINKGDFMKNTQNLYNAAVGGVVDSAFMGDEYTAGATDDTYIVRLEKNVPQRIRMFVWLEGQDVDCIDHTEASSFAIQLELAGSNSND